MVVRILPDKKEIKLSVRDLATMDIIVNQGYRTTVYAHRLTRGREVHTHYQKEQIQLSTEFVAEKHLKYEFIHNEWTIQIQGRIDGFLQSNKGITIEEVKTASVISWDKLDKKNLPNHFVRQLQIYWFILEIQETLPIKAFLIFIHPVNRKQKRFEVEKDDCETFIKSKIKAIIDNWEKGLSKRLVKQANADKLNFPFSTFRGYQEELVEEVTTILKDRQSTLITAPTGIGKTAAILFPALQFALKKGKRIFFCTAKTTQQRIVMETLELIKKRSSEPIQAIFVLLAAKSKMCLREEEFCDPNVCHYLKNYMEFDLASIEEIIHQRKIIKPRFLKSYGKKAEICPFELALDVTTLADIVIGDYNYVFDPTVYLRRFFQEEYNDWIFLIDEVHNLYSRGCGYYSPHFSINDISNIQTSLKKIKHPNLIKGFNSFFNEIHGSYRQLISDYKPTGNETEQKFVTNFTKKNFRKLKNKFDDLLLQYEDFKLERKLLIKNDPLIDFYLEFKRFTLVLDLGGKELSHIIDIKKKEFQLLCKDPSKHLSKRLKGAYASIGFSATLIPPTFYADVLGFTGISALLKQFPSPFPSENQEVIVIPNISTRFKDRKKSILKIINVLLQIVKVHRGNYLVFFPSFNYLNMVLEKGVFELSAIGYEVVFQSAIMSDRARRDFLKKFRTSKGVIGFVVTSGIFAEGIDLPGEELIGAIIIGPALPKYNFDQEIIREYYDVKRSGKGFFYAYIYPGMQRVVQAGGRVVRSASDRGCIILLGERFSSLEYQRTFPYFWFKTAPEELVTKDYQKRLHSFWMSFD